MVFCFMSEAENEIQENGHDLNSNDSKTLVIGSGVRMEGKIDGAMNLIFQETLTAKLNQTQ